MEGKRMLGANSPKADMVFRATEIVLFSILIVTTFMLVWCTGEDNPTVLVCIVVGTIILMIFSLGNLLADIVHLFKKKD